MLDTEKLRAIVGPEGPLSKHIRNFETREQQQNMLVNVAEAYNEKQISLIEAGTGTGKSFAYLIPAIASALTNKETTVISTATINLQEQLFHKDLPLLLKAIGANVKVSLVKGMGNYLCKRKLEDLQHERATFTLEEVESLKYINGWALTTDTGSLTDVPGNPNPGFWERMNADPYSCTHKECPNFRECHFFKSRNDAKDARILIVNHHLLFTDLLRRYEEENYDKTAILPPYQHIILDEAHNIEEIATDFFGARAGRMMILRLLSRIHSEKKGASTGKIHLLKEQLTKVLGKKIPPQATSIFTKMNVDLLGMRQNLGVLLNDAFREIELFVDKMTSSFDGEAKLWMKEEHYENTLWKEKVVPAIEKYTQEAYRFIQSIESVCRDIEKLEEKKTAGARADTLGLISRFQEFTDVMTHFMKKPDDPNLVRWIEARKMKRGGINIDLIDACLDVSHLLVDHLFSHFNTIILSSATIATNGQFDYLKKRLGLKISKRAVSEYIYNSPFNFRNQAVFAVPSDMVPPSHPDFNSQCIEKIEKFVHAADGNTFVLFTSYSALNKCYDALEQKLYKKGHLPLKQGEEQRHTLLEKFKKNDRSVLFGTDSFWEGVDVVGDGLRSVIIVKLPFKVPSEPIVKARSDAITQEGGNPFFDYSVPDAIMKFKQGFGRLIRHKDDRGCVICLDNRLITKGYGRLFINSLPKCKTVIDSTERISDEMCHFYKF